MKKLNVTMIYSMIGQTSIGVPDDMTIEDAVQYAQDNIRDIPIPTDGTYMCESESIDEKNCDFETNFKCNNCGETWCGTRDLESDDYPDFCPECGSVNINEVN